MSIKSWSWGDICPFAANVENKGFILLDKNAIIPDIFILKQHKKIYGIIIFLKLMTLSKYKLFSRLNKDVYAILSTMPNENIKANLWQQPSAVPALRFMGSANFEI